MNEEILNDLRSFNWQKVIDVGNSLDDLSDAQWRFIKGFVAEILVEGCSGTQESKLDYVGEVHKDYVWRKHNIDVELKSQLSDTMYKKDGTLRKRYGLKLNNSLGTNKKEKPEPHEVADIIIVVRKDGAWAINRDTAIEYSVKGGDGFEVILPADKITQITGKVEHINKYNTNFKERIKQLISETISSL